MRVRVSTHPLGRSAWLAVALTGFVAPTGRAHPLDLNVTDGIYEAIGGPKVEIDYDAESMTMKVTDLDTDTVLPDEKVHGSHNGAYESLEIDLGRTSEFRIWVSGGKLLFQNKAWPKVDWLCLDKQPDDTSGSPPLSSTSGVPSKGGPSGGAPKQ